MPASPLLFCVDIGNTHTHYGIVGAGGLFPASATDEIATPQLDHPVHGLEPILRRHLAAADTPIPVAVAFCSVVPAAAPLLRRALEPLGRPIWQLTHRAKLGIPITYPQPTEIGQDRLANAAGAHAIVGAPAIVIDLGTAVTFDIVTRAGGYEGGIITPGPALMTRYLHERTAQLPLVEDVISPVTTAIGKSTVEAMRIGAVLGFTGMIQTLLDALQAELSARGETPAPVLTSGGATAIVAGRLRQTVTDLPDLTLRGLAAAWALDQVTA